MISERKKNSASIVKWYQWPIYMVDYDRRSMFFFLPLAVMLSSNTKNIMRERDTKNDKTNIGKNIVYDIIYSNHWCLSAYSCIEPISRRAIGITGKIGVAFVISWASATIRASRSIIEWTNSHGITTASTATRIIKNKWREEEKKNGNINTVYGLCWRSSCLRISFSLLELDEAVTLTIAVPIFLVWKVSANEQCGFDLICSMCFCLYFISFCLSRDFFFLSSVDSFLFYFCLVEVLSDHSLFLCTPSIPVRFTLYTVYRTVHHHSTTSFVCSFVWFMFLWKTYTRYYSNYLICFLNISIMIIGISIFFRYIFAFVYLRALAYFSIGCYVVFVTESKNYCCLVDVGYDHGHWLNGIIIAHVNRKQMICCTCFMSLFLSLARYVHSWVTNRPMNLQFLFFIFH